MRLGNEAVNGNAPAVEVQHVSKWYKDVVAVSDISFEIHPGVTGLLGPNGAGKTTLFKMVAGLSNPSSGSVKLLGQKVRSNPALYRRVALVPEEEAVYPFLTGREFVQLNAVLQRLEDPTASAERALSMVEMLPESGRVIRGYSKGMIQRVKIAAALVHQPDVLMLDEPLNGTDPYQRVRLMELIRSLGASGHSVIVSSHVLSEVERLADNILVVVNGKLAAAGNFRTIREKLDEHSHIVRLRVDNPRRLAAALTQARWIKGVRLDGRDVVIAETDSMRDFYREIAGVAKAVEVRLYEIAALDDSLASVVAYVTER